MIEEQDIQVLERRLDQRYKQIRDCNDEMDAMRKENTQIVSDVSAIKTSVDSLKWLGRTTLAAVIGGLVAGVFLLLRLLT